MALPTRRTTASLRRAPSSSGANTARRASPLSSCTLALPGPGVPEVSHRDALPLNH